ncbi:MAG: YggS family pyridoxal phosphate-dependent enzyme [Candidatus Latescibacterota bacterium]|nr:MAG: YggS family pyridoxal phosphate-dependent enzyme [Candidatus Latescibacterota bacterium]
MTLEIAENLLRVQERVRGACDRSQRRYEDVTIVGITKTFGPDRVDALVQAGIENVGENRVQEFLDKKPRVTMPCRWHLVGTLQRNKATKVIGQFELIHSVDRIKLAETLSRLGSERARSTHILLEVNTSGESTKHGFGPDEVADVVGRVDEMPRLELDGLMTIGPFTDDLVRVRRAFQRLKRLKEDAERALGRNLRHLSMGMTDDFEIAIEEGATLIRLGRVLLGERGR